MNYYYKICSWYKSSCVENGVKKNVGDLFEILTTGTKKSTLPEVKKSAKLDWQKARYLDKTKRLEIFEDNKVVYMYDSQYGEWTRPEEIITQTA